MRFAPHTGDDDAAMLGALGLESVESLFDTIPVGVRPPDHLEMRSGHAEPEARERLAWLASRNRTMDDLVSFMGGGVYDHYVPAFVDWVVSRSEFATAYTPYQAELSQGLLHGLFEFQSVTSEVFGLPVASASLYDGATALVEAARLCQVATGRRRVLVARGVDPRMRQVLATYAPGLGLELVYAPLGPDGYVDVDQVAALADNAAAVIVQHPDVLGILEPIPDLARVAHDAGARLVVHFDPLLSGVLEPPGRLGADVVVGDGISAGNHPSMGGPGVGMMAVDWKDLRLLPGRLVGETRDADDRRAFVLTLQAREQHIRRERATSNICTNQALNALATVAYLSWLGPGGLTGLGRRSMSGARLAADRLDRVAEVAYPDAPIGKEFALRVPDPHLLSARLAEQGFLVGPVVTVGDEDLLLVAVTEQRTIDQVVRLEEAIGEVGGGTPGRSHRPHRPHRPHRSRRIGGGES